MVRKRMTASERRESIIKATIEVVSRSNYDRATTAAIAKKAGVNEALIYSHFKNKQKLQLATLDYLLDYRIRIYASNPVFKEENKSRSIIRELNRQYMKEIQKPDIDMFACILKSLFAIDPRIREKGWDIVKAFHDFNKQMLIEDRKRGFFTDKVDPDVIAWEILGKITLLSISAINGKLDGYSFEQVGKSMAYFEAFFMSEK